MRLKKLSLVAAAGLGVCLSGVAATTSVAANGSLAVTTLTGDYDLASNSTLTVNMASSSTYSGRIIGSGDVVKTGAGVLQIDSYSDMKYYNGISFIGRDGPAPTDFMLYATTGSLRVREGGVMVSGYLNQWADFGTLANPNLSTGLPSLTGENQYLGYSKIVLEGNALLSVQNAQLNVSSREEAYDGTRNNPVLPGSVRLVYLRNLKAGDGDNQNQTQLDAGGDASRVVLHTTTGETGSIGSVSGSGRLIKTGSGTFTILNDSRFTGDVLIGGGTFELNSPTGGALSQAKSINVGLGGTGGAFTGRNFQGTWMTVPEWRPAYAAGAGAGILSVSGTQTVNNLQALFNTNNIDYLNGDGRLEPFGVSTGGGSTISFANENSVLVMNQVMNGFFSGNITGGGAIIKASSGTFALMGGIGNYKSLTVRNGKLLSNVQMLGGGAMYVGDAFTDGSLAAPELVLVQNDAGTLRAVIHGLSSGTLVFKATDSILDARGNEVTVGNGQIGSIDIFAKQTEFYGTVRAEGGITLAFNAASGDALVNAKAVVLQSGPNGEETTLAFNDTNQTFRNFQGDAATRLNLGRGTVTIVQSENTDYAGKVTGVGGFVKAGTGSFRLSGRDAIGGTATTYAGATVVREGALILGGANQLEKSSGLVLAGGKTQFDANQTFGALYGASGAVLSLGSSTLTIGASSARLAQIRAESAAFDSYAPGYYLATEGDSTLPGATSVLGYGADTTKAFLRSVLSSSDAGVVASANADYINDLAYAGTIEGSGVLIKQGSERLTLSGVNSLFTGRVSVLSGILQTNADSLNALTGGIEVASGAVYALNAKSKQSVPGIEDEQQFSSAVSGAGDFEKTGLGTARLVKPLALSGAIAVKQGMLVLNLGTTANRRFRVDSGAILNLDQPVALTVSGTLSGEGTLRKTGAGGLNASALDTDAFLGAVDVRAGSLTLAKLGTGNISVAAGATFVAGVTNTVYSGKLSGAGTVKVSGGTLTLTSPSNGAGDAFTGTLSMTSGSVIAGASNLYTRGTIELISGSTFNLNGTTQTLAGIQGDASSSITLGGGTLAVDAIATTEFSGQLQGSGTVRKTGAGEFRLTGSVNTGWGASVVIEAGRLVAAPQALGGASVSIGAGATFALHNADTVNSVDFSNAILSASPGAGTIDKTGAGAVSLANGGAFSGTVQVTEGELRASSGGIGGKVFPNVTVANNAAYAVVLGQNEILDFTDGNKVEGAGSLAIEGGKTLTLQGTQLYTGNTILRGTGTTLDLRADNRASINGLDSGTASAGLHVVGSGAGTIVNAGDALTVVQNTEGTFDGVINLTGTANLVTITGAKKLYLTNAGTLKFNVDGGHLQLDSSAANEVVLINSGTLYSTGGLYDSSKITGAGNVMLSDANASVALDSSQTSALAYAGKIGVDAGSLQLDVSGLNQTRITGLVAAKSGPEREVVGSLKLDVAGGLTESLATAVSGDGVLEKVGVGKLVINDATGSTSYLNDFSGHFSVSVGTLGGSFSTRGDLSVGTAARLAPGNSPGLITVNGNLALAGQLDIEVTNRNVTPGVDFDQVVVKAQRDSFGNPISGTGVATLGGTLRVEGFGALKPVRGVGYRIITAEGGITGDFSAVDTSTSPVGVAGRRVLIVTPARSAEVNGDLQGLGAANAVTIYVVDRLNETLGYAPHSGISALNAQLDTFVFTADGTPVNALGARLAVAAPESLDAVVNALSPLGYGALYAMDRETGLRQEERIRERLEQRRYDNATERDDPWEAFVVGSASQATNKVERDTPTFDYNTYGGMVGLDKKLEHGPVVGGAVGYDTGSAKLHQGAGRIEMTRVRATAFASTMVTSRWFVDGGLSAGFADFSAKRETLTGRNTATMIGYDVGANVATGTVVTLRSDLFLTPYAAVSYAHHEFDGFTEKGSTSRLKVDGWSQDSLRTSLGTGLGWWLPAGDMKVKLGLDVAYNHELLDTDSEINARFAQAGGSAFRTTAAALPGDSISVGPSVSLGFDEVTSISAGYTYEMGFDGRAYNAFNIAFRRRF